MGILQERLIFTSWKRAALGMLLTCLLSLSVHVAMLQILHVPYPDNYPVSGWPAFLSLVLSTLGVVYFHELAFTESPCAIHFRFLLLFALAAMLRESLRLPVMDSFATSAWRYSFVNDAPRVITVLLICGLVVVLPKLPHFWQKGLAAVTIATILNLVLLPALHSIFRNILASIAYLSHNEIYKAPYGWQIEVPAYITFMEPVIACFLMACLVWNRLGEDAVRRTLGFVLLVLLVSNALIRPFVYVFYSEFSPGVALLSMGQFFLETSALALLTALNWRFSQIKVGTDSRLV